MNKKEIENKIAEFSKRKDDAIKNQDYLYASLMRDRINELREQLKKLDI